MEYEGYGVGIAHNAQHLLGVSTKLEIEKFAKKNLGFNFQNSLHTVLRKQNFSFT